jgi:hypothetical protein
VIYAPGATFNITIEGFSGNENFSLTLFSTPQSLGTYTTDANGSATVSVTLPTDLDPGNHSIVANGANGETASFAFTVVAPAGAAGGPAAPVAGGGTGGGGLAFTGVAVGGALLVAIGLLVAGTIVLITGRRRASH